MQKENADEKARRVRLLRIWTDICAMALCEMPEGRSERYVHCEAATGNGRTTFVVKVYSRDMKVNQMFVTDTLIRSCEEELADIQRRLKPYVA